MNDATPPVRPALDTQRLKHGGFLQLLGLVFSSWVGILVGGLLLIITGGAFAAVTLSINGIWAVPLFGTIFAYVGLSRARDAAIRATKTEVLAKDHPLASTVATLARELGLAPPQVGIYPDKDMNAFASGSGPDKAVVSFSQGLIDRMGKRELLAVAAHELAHIANRDMRRMVFANSFQNALTWYLFWTDTGQSLARWVLGTIGELLVLRLSRTREYWADATSAALLGKQPMIDALNALRGDQVRPTAERLAYARLMIRGNPGSLFSTHPTIDERIAALEQGTYIRRLPYRTLPRPPGGNSTIT